jgi:cytoskeletal protein CcmA (bactofilin family)
MFKSKSTSTSVLPSSSNSIIGAGTTIIGNIESNGDIRIDGTLKGNLYGKAKVLIGPEGLVQGDISGEEADIFGTVTGKINIKELLHLKARAEVQGDILAGKLQIEPTVVFNGSCQMGANVVELKNIERANAVNQ